MDEPLIVTRAMSAAAIAACRYVQEWVRPRGLVDAAQLHLMRTPERIAVLAFERHESVGVYGDREVEILRLLLPHVRRAVTISNVLDVQAIEKARMAETHDALKLGVVLANEDSRILHANRAAEEMMRDGVWCRRSLGHEMHRGCRIDFVTAVRPEECRSGPAHIAAIAPFALLRGVMIPSPPEANIFCPPPSNRGSADIRDPLDDQSAGRGLRPTPACECGFGRIEVEPCERD